MSNRVHHRTTAALRQDLAAAEAKTKHQDGVIDRLSRALEVRTEEWTGALHEVNRLRALADTYQARVFEAPPVPAIAEPEAGEVAEQRHQGL